MSDSELSLKYQQLLRDLKTTVEGLLNSQVVNVWHIYGGLNRLHVDVEKIFKHGCKCTSNNTNSDYWLFIQGLEWLRPDTSNSTYTIDCEYKPHIPNHIKNDKASIWLYRSLENHSLSQKLSWLISDKTHLLSCYQNSAFLCQESYAEATLICLRAVERNQPSLISEIKPNLFIMHTSAKEYYKIHRRCSSFPDAQLKIEAKNKSSQSFERGATLNEIEHCLSPRRIKGKLKAWNSMPNLCDSNAKLRLRAHTIAQSYTTPSTPNHTNNSVKFERSLKRSTMKSSVKRCDKVKLPKHVIINNQDIVEHTPPLSSSQGSSSKDEMKSMKSPTRSLGSSAPEFSILSSLSGIAGEKDFLKKPKKTFIEDGGMSVLPMATGYFPRPTKGQSLTSFLMSSQLTRTNAELDRENAHFNISEAMISAMEQIKCRKHIKLADDDSDEEINHLKQRIRLRWRLKYEEKQRRFLSASLLSDGKTDTAEPSISSYSSSPGTYSSSESSEDNIEIDELSSYLFENRGLSVSMASLFSEADLLQRPRGVPDGASDILSAEGVALSLISKFSEKQLPRASDLEWLVSEEDAPQALLPLPKSWPVSPDDSNEHVTALRGTHEWAPPRPQVIVTLHPYMTRKTLIAKQNYRCAGCGMRVAKQYASKFRYCHYLGRYFCTGCHTNQLAIIPARVIQKWNFSRYPVSSFSYRLLEQMYTDPLFPIFELNKNVANHSRSLVICKKYRHGLKFIKDFILTCRFAEPLQDLFKSEQSYLFNDSDIYSMQDLVNIGIGELKSRLKYIVELSCKHISECELCFKRGFICEICKSKEVIFPWQMRIVNRCSKCGSCYHAKCWPATSDAPCIRCDRMNKRRECAGCSSTTTT